MTVQSLVKMFETIAVSARVDTSKQLLESLPNRSNVLELVAYYDALKQTEESIVTKSVRPDKSVVIKESQPPKKMEVQMEKMEVQMEDEMEDEMEKIEVQQKHMQSSIRCQESSTRPTVSKGTRLSQSRVLPNFVSKIPQPKSRELHLATCLKTKSTVADTFRTRVSTSSSKDANEPVVVSPPVPVSNRVRSPAAYYGAFVARIENSESRLLDFEKNERWLKQMKSMKSRVEELKKSNHIALAKEVASMPRKKRSLSECSADSTASTSSISSMDMPCP